MVLKCNEQFKGGPCLACLACLACLVCLLATTVKTNTSSQQEAEQNHSPSMSWCCLPKNTPGQILRWDKTCHPDWLYKKTKGTQWTIRNTEEIDLAVCPLTAPNHRSWGHWWEPACDKPWPPRWHSQLGLSLVRLWSHASLYVFCRSA